MRWRILIPMLATLAVCGAVAEPSVVPEKRPASGLTYDARQATIARVAARDSAQDTRLRLVLRVPMGSPGWRLSTASVGHPDASGHVRVDLDATSLPGAWPAVMTDMEHTITLDPLPEGVYLLEIRVGSDGADRVLSGATTFCAVAAP